MRNNQLAKRFGSGLECLETRVTPATLGVDIVFLVDISGSMIQGDNGPLKEAAWLADVVNGDSTTSNPDNSEAFALAEGLEGALVDAGVGAGSSSDDVNRYGLVVFDDNASVVDISPNDATTALGSASQFATAIAGDFAKGNGSEDGYGAIESAIDSFGASDNAVRFVLVTDTGRDGATADCTTVSCLRDELRDNDIELDVIGDSSIATSTGELVVGATSVNEAIAFGNGERLLIGMDNGEAVAKGEQIAGVGPLSYRFTQSSIGDIGPDGFGYSADRKTASFEDISSANNAISDGFHDLPSGFGFGFYGDTKSEIYVSQRGAFSFDIELDDLNLGPSDLNTINDEISNGPSSAEDTIAVLWNDKLVADANSGVYMAHRSSPERLIVQWKGHEWSDGVDGASNSEYDLNFQAVLYADGDIQLNYQNVPIADPLHDSNWTSGIVGPLGDLTLASNAPEIRTPVQTLIDATGDSNGREGGGGTHDQYADLAWESGGTFWNLGIARTNADASVASEKLRATFVQETVKQVLGAAPAFTVDLIDAAIGGDDLTHDYDNDGSVTADDVDYFLHVLNEFIPGDLDFDGTVAFADFLLLSQNFGQSDNVVYSDGDIDGDGIVGFGDFLILSQNFGQSSL